MVLLSDLVTQVRQRLNIENSNNITDAEITNYLNFSLAELYGLMTEASDDWNTYRIVFTIPPTEGINDGYQLPADFWKLVRVDRSLDNQSTYYTLSRVALRDENLYNPALKGYYYYPSVTGYITEVKDGYTYLRILPQTNKQGIYQVLYYPAYVTLSLSDEVRIGPPGQYWEEYAILDACIKCAVKEETDPQAFILQKAAMIQRVMTEASTRDVGQTEPPPMTGPAWYDRVLGYNYWSR